MIKKISDRLTVDLSKVALITIDVDDGDTFFLLETAGETLKINCNIDEAKTLMGAIEKYWGDEGDNTHEKSDAAPLGFGDPCKDGLRLLRK